MEQFADIIQSVVCTMIYYKLVIRRPIKKNYTRSGDYKKKKDNLLYDNRSYNNKLYLIHQHGEQT